MAHQSQRILGFLARYRKTKCGSPRLHSSTYLFPFSFSTLDVPVDVFHGNSSQEQRENLPSVDERRVLDELSDLLSMPHRSTPRNRFTETYSEKNVGFRAVDGFLTPEDKLRGVFLQKLKGRTAIEHALINVGVDLTTDVVFRVMNRGNLGGEAMVVFFNWAIKQPEIPKDICSYHLLIKALGRRKFFNFMEDVLQDMRLEGISPNRDTLLIVLDSYVRACKVNKAIQMFRKLEEIGLTRDTDSLNVLLRCLCQRSHVGAANKVFNAMKGKISFDSMTYNLIISGWAKFGRVGEIERCLGEMGADGFTADCSTFSYRIEGLGRAGQIDGAVAVFNDMEEKGCVPDASVYNAMISNFSSVGKFDQCLKCYEQMLSRSCDPNMDTYTKLIAGFLKGRKVADALEMFDEMLGQGITPTTGMITSFIQRLCSYGPPHAALMIYKKARKVGCKISLSAYKMLLMRLSRFGKCGTLLSTWDDMQESGYPPDTEAYEYVINGLCNIGQLENAALIMEESLRKGFCPGRLVCSKLNNKLLSSNKVERAYKLFLKIKVARCNENARRYWRSNGWHF